MLNIELLNVENPQITMINFLSGVGRLRSGSFRELQGRKDLNTRTSQKVISQKWPREFLFSSVWLNKLTNKLMKRGKKGGAEKTVFAMLQYINQAQVGPPLLVFHQALELLKPVVSTVKVRRGSRFYEVPVPISSLRQYKIALKWLLAGAGEYHTMEFAKALACEIVGVVVFRKGNACRYKDRLYGNVARNRAYLHYRW